MALEDIKKLAAEKAKEDPKFKVDFIDDAITTAQAAGAKAEKATFSVELKKKNDEAKGLRKYKIALEENFDFNPETDDVSEFVSGLKGKVKDGNSNSQKSAEFDELNKNFKKLNTAFSTLKTDSEKKDQENADLKIKGDLNTISTQLNKDLTEKNVIGVDYAVKGLIADKAVGLDESGKVVSKDGDTDVEYDKGLEKWLDGHKDMIKSEQTGGGGSGASDGGNGSGSPSEDDVKYAERIAAGG